MCEEEKSNLYIYAYSDLVDDFIFAETKYTLGELHKLQKENKILKENAEHNDKVVDKVNWENQLLKKENQKLKEQLQQKEDIINKAKEYIEKHNETIGKLYFKCSNMYLLSEIKEDLIEILDNKGE